MTATSSSPERIDAIVDDYHDRIHDRRIHLRPDIPAKKLHTAIQAYAPGVTDDDVLAVLDETVFGNGKDGCLLTRTALYAHEIVSEPKRVELSEIDRLECRPSGVNGSVLYVDDERFQPLEMSDRAANEQFAEMVRLIINRPSPLAPPAAPAAAAAVATPVHTTEKAPEDSSRVELELFHLVRADSHVEPLVRTTTASFVKVPLVVTRPEAGKVKEPHRCPECGQTFEVTVWSAAVVTKWLAISGAVLLGGVLTLALLWLTEGAWLGTSSQALTIAMALIGAVGVGCLFLGGVLGYEFLKLMANHGVQTGPVGKNDIFFRGLAGHTIEVISPGSPRLR